MSQQFYISAIQKFLGTAYWYRTFTREWGINLCVAFLDNAGEFISLQRSVVRICTYELVTRLLLKWITGDGVLLGYNSSDLFGGGLH